MAEEKGVRRSIISDGVWLGEGQAPKQPPPPTPRGTQSTPKGNAEPEPSLYVTMHALDRLVQRDMKLGSVEEIRAVRHSREKSLRAEVERHVRAGLAEGRKGRAKPRWARLYKEKQPQRALKEHQFYVWDQACKLCFVVALEHPAGKPFYTVVTVYHRAAA